MKKNQYKMTAFTLAEALLTLTILGVLVAITTPIMKNALPNFNIYRVKKINTTLKSTIDDMLNNHNQYEGNHDFSNTGYILSGSDIIRNTETFRNIFIKSVDMKETMPCHAHGAGGGIDLKNCYVSVDNIVWAIPNTDFVSNENGSVVIELKTEGVCPEGECKKNYFVPITVYPDYKKEEANKNPDSYMKDNAIFYGVRRDGKIIFFEDINCENNPRSMQCLAMREIASSKMKKRR